MTADPLVTHVGKAVTDARSHVRTLEADLAAARADADALRNRVADLEAFVRNLTRPTMEDNATFAHRVISEAHALLSTPAPQGGQK